MHFRDDAFPTGKLVPHSFEYVDEVKRVQFIFPM